MPEQLNIPIVTSKLVPRGQMYVLGGQLHMHPVEYLRMRYPTSPVWCERTLGHQEMERDRRKHGR